jgi:membrane protein
LKPLWARVQASKPWRAWKRYGDARGNILAAGIGYFAFFSIFPAVALAFTVFGFVLHGHPKLLQSVADNLNANLPGFVKDAQHHDGLIPIQAPHAAALTITGVIAFITLLLAGMGWLGAVRDGVRAVFGAHGSLGNLVTTKLRDLGVLFTLGLGILISAVLTTVVGFAAGWIAERIGMSGHGWILVVAGFPVSVLVDTGLMMLLIRVLSGVPVPWRALYQGALVGGVGFSLLKVFADTLLARLTSNPLFASIAIVFGLLIWLNLIARLTLVSAAWVANDFDQIHGVELEDLASSPAQLAGSGAKAARGEALPTFGTRTGDRTTLAAGAVLGATGAVLVTTVMMAAGRLTRGIRSAVSLLRR